ncbi:MAG: M20 family metallopeptidase [Pseudomonadota bacterium]
MTRQSAITQARRYLSDGAFEADLARRVAYRTESQVPDGLPHARRYLDEEMAPAFARLGFETQIFENPFPDVAPVMLATRNEGAPVTVLGYGHGDVVRGQDAAWTKGAGPWVTHREGDRLYGRGTADNKAQHTINMAAMEAVLAARGALGFNAKVIIEMAEEAGSRGLREIIAQNKAAFAADVFIASDGPRVRPDRPTVSLGARGALNFDLVCDLREGGHHSGNWGGALADPAMILAQSLASLSGPNGEILVDAWKAPAMSPAVKAALAGLTLDPGPDGPAIDANWGEPCLTTAERVYGANSFAVLAMSAGDIAAPVNAIQPRASAHCQLRFVAGTEEADILPGLRRHLDQHGFDRVGIRESEEGGFAASRTEPDDPWVSRVTKSIAETTGSAPAVIPQMGGSICNDLFTELLGLPAIWVPHSYSGCSQHAPDEHVLVSVSESALTIMAGLYWDIGS